MSNKNRTFAGWEGWYALKGRVRKLSLRVVRKLSLRVKGETPYRNTIEGIIIKGTRPRIVYTLPNFIVLNTILWSYKFIHLRNKSN